ncbi:hypothetical protein TPHA_0B00330 [Tetrapisispora phaffii CBS 4417]|uniref:Histone transcription regulator 3 homolog n=1 Tax=Tetrapisispora phaffii (strain ATCC 24235 / CBS 4417 / NBRC 1672 / NRRL Y-8282 / UCD 70-5) TaxID=1071381 RepID=G8BQA8_TETPH|nr:hypothetical protein TPHA_0B00330 [Tetrapisispora phaffii CBS 4417]CCE61705.1 hypothetical protein TPHA_0B00330 [Tetrapisispora phaffii CBS 4417]
MSKFNALNQDLHDEEFEVDGHSRELQVEEGFKTFQTALQFLRNKKYDDASDKFDELFQMAILKADKWGLYQFSSPTLDSLRYLAFRNRGMFYYSYLIDEYASMETDEIVNYILKVVEDLLESMQHSYADSSVTELLLMIFRSFRSRKLERLIIEYELKKPDNQFLTLERLNKNKILPKLKNVLDRYTILLNNLHDTKTIETSTIIKDNNINLSSTSEFNIVLNKINQMKTQDDKEMKKLDRFEVNIKNMSWDDILGSFKSLVVHMKSTNMLLRDYDTYAETEYPIEAIKFNLSDKALINSDTSLTMQKNDVSDEKEEIASINATNKSEPDSSLIPETKDNDNIDFEIEGTNKNNDSVKNDKNDKNDDIDSDSNISTDADRHKKKRQSTSVEDLSRPAQRVSKRVKNEHVVDEKKVFELHQIFINDFFSSCSMINMESCFNKEGLESIIQDGILQSNKTYYVDFFNCLKNWNSKHADIFIQNAQVPSKSKIGESNTTSQSPELTSLLKYNGSNEYGEKQNYPERLEDADPSILENFIGNINRGKMHFQEVRFKIIDALLSKKNEQERIIISHLWSKSLYQNLEWLLSSVESSMFEFVKTSFNENKYLILSIIEVLINMSGSINDEINHKTLQGTKVNELKVNKYKLQAKINKWIQLAENIDYTDDILWNVEFLWSKFCFFQFCEDFSNKDMINLCTKIEKQLSNYDKKLYIVYPNYNYISCLSRDFVKSNIKKISIIDKLTIIDSYSDNFNTETEFKHDGNMLQLEKVLLRVDGEQARDNDDKEIISFIDQSPFVVQINLWKVLFNYYIDVEDIQKSIKIYFCILQLLFKKLDSTEYVDHMEQNRHQMLLLYISDIDYFTTKVVNILSTNAWSDIGYEPSATDFKGIFEIFSIFYLVFYFETSSKVDSSLKSFFQRAHKSAGKMKDSIAALSTLILYFFNSSCIKMVSHEEAAPIITKIVWNIHSLLGEFKSCDAASGNFLRFTENLLCRFINDDTYLQLLQTLWCHYHYSLSSDSVSFEYHTTQPVPIDKVNSLPLGTYLIKLQYSGRNPLLVNSNKSTLKQVLDNIINTLEDPCDSPNFFIENNKYKLDEYLSLPLTTDYLKKSFNGLCSLRFSSPNDEFQEAIEIGLYYIASVQALNLYKLRKKSMQARPSELDSIINMIKIDIIYNFNRYESWYLLGLCFSYIVEDDLMWTSDKLNVPEKKNTIASNQRKAILCYLMSINVFYQKNEVDRDDKKVMIKVLEALGMELIIGLYKPMDMECFQFQRAHKYLQLGDDGELAEKMIVEINSISSFNIEQAALLCFNRSNKFREALVSSKDSKERWQNYYYISRLLFKKGRLTMLHDIEKVILRACKLAMDVSTPKDLIVEPHYYLLVMCYKWVKLNVLSPYNALQILSKDIGFFDVDNDFWDIDNSISIDYQKKSFYKKSIEFLRIIQQSDKRKWHHRPTYRISKILFEDFGDLNGAIKEIETMMSLKTMNKNLINIWKPDFERPGKHFVYTYQYITFYIDLLFIKKDHISIGLIAKKIRRFSSGMAYSSEVIKKSVTTYIRCVATSLHLDEKYYSEQFLPNLNYQEFIDISKEVLQDFDPEKYSADILESLQIAYQLKRGNNGIAFDGTCLSIYFKYFYLPYLEAHPRTKTSTESQIVQFVSHETVKIPSASATSIQPKQNNSRKRVSKKDAFETIRTMTEKIH